MCLHGELSAKALQVQLGYVPRTTVYKPLPRAEYWDISSSTSHQTDDLERRRGRQAEDHEALLLGLGTCGE